jgi:protein-S-isoprenylcysteine O-methyltransferase Ste14
VPDLRAPRAEYAWSMEKTGPSFGARIVAAIVLVVAAWLLFKVVIGIVAGVAYFLVVVVAVIAVVWAVRTLF